MTKKKYRKQKNDTALFAVGGGLVLLAIAIIILLAHSNAQTSSDTGQAFATIPAEVNYPAPELALENVNGRTESLADYDDQVILVNNWATWCPPCKAEMPTLVDYYNEHNDEGLMIVAVEAGEPKEEVMVFVDKFAMPFAVWLDPKGLATSAFKNNSLPSSYVIDRNGTVRLAWTGEISREMLEKYVTPLLNE